MYSLMSKEKKERFNQEKLVTASALLRAVSNTTRLLILETIDKKAPQKMQEIYMPLKLEESIVSNHIAIMEDAWVVRSYSSPYSSKEKITKINYGTLAQLNKALERFLPPKKKNTK